MKIFWATGFAFVVALTIVTSATGQGPGPIDALATQSAVNAQATRSAIDAQKHAAQAAAAAAEAQRIAAAAASQATAQALNANTKAAQAQATTDAVLLQATVATGATRSAIEAQATRSALDELDRQRAATATSEAINAQATAISVASSIQATAQAQAMQKERDRTLGFWLIFVEIIALVGLLYLAMKAVRIASTWLEGLKPVATQADVPVHVGEVIETPFTVKVESQSSRLPPMKFVSNPPQEALDYVESLFAKGDDHDDAG